MGIENFLCLDFATQSICWPTTQLEKRLNLASVFSVCFTVKSSLVHLPSEANFTSFAMPQGK